MGTRSEVPDKGNQPPPEGDVSTPPTDTISNEEANEPPVTMASIRELMLITQGNINKSTQEIIEDLWKDVNVISEKLDKTGEKFKEAEGRISAIEDRMNNMEDTIAEVGSINKRLETAIENSDRDSCVATRNNVIVQGLPGESSFCTLCIEKLGFNQERGVRRST